MQQTERLQNALVACVALGTLLSTSKAVAAPTLAGNTGLIKIPTAAVLDSGELTIGFSWVGGPRSYLFKPQTNRMYYVSLGVLPGLEVSLDMLQVIGWIDPDAPGVAYAMHRLSNAKYRLPLPEGWPQVAVGTQDPFSANALTRGPAGQTNYGLTTYYSVVTQPIGPLSVHLGYAQSPDFIRGAFGGADMELGYGVNVRAEYDSQQWNTGLHWQPVSWFSLYAARLFPDDWGYGTALTWRL